MSDKENRGRGNCRVFQKRKPGGGRRSFEEKHAEVVASVEEYIRQNSFAADARRRSTTGQACGVTLPMIQSYIKEKHELDVSMSTIHRWMIAPKKNINASSYYKGIIDARVACKRNDVRKLHEDAHYLSARVRYRLEFHAMFEDEVFAMSCDNKHKIKIGTQAVSRYFRVGKIFMNDDAPNYPDHDFPLPGHLITPCGYMVLNIKEPGKQVTDEQGRLHYAFARTGESFIFNRGPWNTMSVQDHINDLYRILPKVMGEKKALVLVVDGGPDWGYKGYANVVFYMRLWRDLNLDLLTVTMYAPGNSAYNPIEHLWSPLSKKLACVVLPAVLPGEDKPPCQQNIPEDEKTQKEKEVIDNAIERLSGYWDGMDFDGYTVNADHIKSTAEAVPYNDYDDVYRLLKGPLRVLREQRHVVEELRFACKHLHRDKCEVNFIKCNDGECHHCSSHPVVAKKTMNFLGKGIGQPIPDPHLEDHYMTFLDQQSVARHRPDGLSAGIGECPTCPGYTFTSKADKKRHISMVHK